MLGISLKVYFFAFIALSLGSNDNQDSSSNNIALDISVTSDAAKGGNVQSYRSDDTLSMNTADQHSNNDNTLLNENKVYNVKDEVFLNIPVEETNISYESSILNNSSSNSTGNSTEISDEKSNITNIVSCNAGRDSVGEPVELVNSTRLINILISESNVTDRRTNADCTLVLFYVRYCPFSSMAAPHFNALARAFPDIKLVAVDAMKYHSFNTQYGIVGVPTLMLFHNGRPAAKFNDTEYNLESFAKFITKYTGIQPYDKLFVTSADFGGPVSSIPTKSTDYYLFLSWAFMFACCLYFFSKSSWWRWISETVQNTWREAEAQHEHGD